MTRTPTQNRAPDADKKYRVNLTLPADLAVMLSDTAKNMSMSQSALVTSLLVDSLPALNKLSRSAKFLQGSDPDPDAVRRFRGESIDTILSHVRKVLHKI